ncbi:ABC transporter ATP-binding protein/permease [Erysipelothrix sp. HDW6C]|uniref:ABC transporter ATP-binding protein/permease n=1 Tax=Erysipelothrix sp. HDW6C TaxID=2714930 RepID=UPI00140A1D78|nr:ABC transporter ATP-binding protein/permease [Erysipelothrix sp. HDW6C]QIK69307.1 ABC transporter ATP-binding protein/permease [Erysipelothrix sp. HDW6C]
MLKLTKIRKSYKTHDFTQVALDDVSVAFRDNEFAAILGTSGSGKTTMLNIIGGLDHYDSGDLEIDGISTKKYKDSDWDSYRNNRIGFVFQSYNLIPHQTILANVELALTLSGVSKSERRKRALSALAEVGLKDHVRKLPSQLSGGQMQRVAIARALINNPEILLADEPTGALDSQTSEQVMQLLTEIAKDRLVIMVTHNPDLADRYATRIIELKDGHVIGDTNPLNIDEDFAKQADAPTKVGMSFFTAISLSLSNLMTKKGRTFVTALAGSIGIIGIAAILALAGGINAYIGTIEEETMSNYPLTIQASGVDITSFLGDPSMGRTKDKDGGDIGVQNIFESMFTYQNSNDLQSLKAYIEANRSIIDPYTRNIQYKYNLKPQIYLEATKDSIEQVNPDAILNEFGLGSSSGMSAIMGGGGAGGMSSFHELPGDISIYEHQFDVKSGRWPTNYDEAVLVLMPDGSVSDLTLYSLGIKDRNELRTMLDTFVNNPSETVETNEGNTSLDFDTIYTSKLKVINPGSQFVYDTTYNVWVDKSDNDAHMMNVIKDGLTLKIVGIVQQSEDVTTSSLSSGVNYTPELTHYLMNQASQTEIVKQQLAKPETNVLTGKLFSEDSVDNESDGFKFADLITVDEDAIRNAFNIDPSNISLDFSGFTIDVSEVAFPAIDFAEISSSIAGQINVPSEDIGQIFTDTLQRFLAEQAAGGITDPAQILQNFIEYLNRPEIQTDLQNQLTQIIGDANIDEQVNDAVSEYMQSIMQTYMTQLMTSVQGQIETQVGSVVSQLPQQLQNSISIDTDALANAFKFNVEEDDILDLLSTIMNPQVASYESTLQKLGYADVNIPSQISIFPKDFTTKDNVVQFLADYNEKMEAGGAEDKIIRYSDLVGTMMSSVTDIVDTISYALIAFVAISLVVSSIMIGVITYVSVLERKKEIGILRAIGASKRDIRRVFNSETLIIGFIAGALGIGVTYILSFFANIIVLNEFGIANIAQLPLQAAAILILISMMLAFLSGLFPSSAAAKKDPVEALRSE